MFFSSFFEREFFSFIREPVNMKGSTYPFRKRLISMMDLRTPKQDDNVKIGTKFKMGDPKVGEVFYKVVSIKNEYLKCRQMTHLKDPGFPDEIILEENQFKYVKIIRNDNSNLWRTITFIESLLISRVWSRGLCPRHHTRVINSIESSASPSIRYFIRETRKPMINTPHKTRITPHKTPLLLIKAFDS